MQVAKNTVVTMDYTLTGPDGAVIDSSIGKAPLPYLHGAANIIPGLEKALEGKAVGDNVKVAVPAAEGYGARDPQMIQAVPRASFQGVANIQPGMQFQARTPQGARIVTVVKVDANEVTVDANHPLAGVDLQFDVTIRSIRAATTEEVQHGHAHGEGGHHH